MPAVVRLQSASSSWAQPGGTPREGIGGWIATANDPVATGGQLAPSFLYAHLFGFSASPAGGAVGLVTSEWGKFAVFSVMEPGGVPHDVAVPFEWKAGRFYFPLVHRLSAGVWRAWVYDHTAATWVPIGTLSLPAAWGGLSGTSTTTAAWFGPTASSCAAYPGADLFFAPPTAFAAGATTDAALVSHASGAGECPAQASTATGGWARYRMGAAP